MSKYYAVKNGRTPGIYRSWDECKNQVTGYSNAIYKSFKSEIEARDYLRGANSNIAEGVTKDSLKREDTNEDLPPTEGRPSSVASSSDGPLGPSCEEVHIYTDGSHKRSKNFLGIGAWCRYKGVEYSLSKTLSRDFLLTYEIDIQKTPVSNPTAEFIAVAEVLKHICALSQVYGVEDDHSKASRPYVVTFHCDYVGPANWIAGNWKAKETYIKKILDVCLKMISKSKITLRIMHVLGHSGVFGNEKADQLAGSGREVDEFDRLMGVVFGDT